MAEECSSCHAEVIWAVSAEEPKPGERVKRNPLDKAAGHAGNLEVWRDGTGLVRYRYLRKGEEPAEGHFRATSHFAVCPNAAQHRRAPGDRTASPVITPGAESWPPGSNGEAANRG